MKVFIPPVQGTSSSQEGLNVLYQFGCPLNLLPPLVLCNRSAAGECQQFSVLEEDTKFFVCKFSDSARLAVPRKNLVSYSKGIIQVHSLHSPFI